MKILLTGAAGFIGARTAQLLLKGGHDVVALDNLNDHYDLRLKIYRLKELLGQAGVDTDAADGLEPLGASPASYEGPGFVDAGRLVFHRLDIENKEALRVLFRQHQFDAVINLAARAGVRYSMVNPDVYMRTNAMGTLNLMDCMRDQGCQKLVLASTSSLYAGQEMPFTEDMPVNEPISPYAASKKAAETMAYTYHHLYDLDVSVVRYFTVFGPAGRPDMSPFRFIKWIDEGQPLQLYGDGEQSRDFTYVDDIARGTIAALQEVGYEVINLGGGNNPISLNEMISFIEDKLGKEANIARQPFHRADMKVTWADITKAGDILGWQPEIDPYDGFDRTIQWHEEYADLVESIEV